MRQVVKEGFREEKNNRVAVWRLEVDYELATLYEAMQKRMKIKSISAKENWNVSEKNGFGLTDKE